MENKYYTPKIEEFCVGFEYEVNGLEGIWDNGKEERKWVHTSIDDNIHQLFAETKRLKEEPQNIRVKYLDKEDIESLGWECIKQHPGTTNFYFERNEYSLDFDPEFGDKWNLRIYDGKDYENEFNYFSGIIKNKSELEKLMKQLNIL